MYQPTNITGGHHLVEISRVMVMVCEKMTGLRFHPRKEFISKSWPMCRISSLTIYPLVISRSYAKSSLFNRETSRETIWANYNDLTATSLGIMVTKGNHPQMALRFRLVKYYNLPRTMIKSSIDEPFSIAVWYSATSWGWSLWSLQPMYGYIGHGVSLKLISLVKLWGILMYEFFSNVPNNHNYQWGCISIFPMCFR